MPTPQPSLSLTIEISQEQLGFLANLYPTEDPEDALIELLDRARNRAIRRAEQQVRVLHPGQEAEECRESYPEQPISKGSDVTDNPIGELQELCQKQQISMPVYEFEELTEGFRCIVLAMGLQGVGEGMAKKQAKVRAAAGLLGLIR